MEGGEVGGWLVGEWGSQEIRGLCQTLMHMCMQACAHPCVHEYEVISDSA